MSNVDKYLRAITRFHDIELTGNQHKPKEISTKRNLNSKSIEFPSVDLRQLRIY